MRPPLESTSVPSAISTLPSASRPVPGARLRPNRTAEISAPPISTTAPTPLPMPASARGSASRWSLPTGSASPVISGLIDVDSITPTARPLKNTTPGPYPVADLAVREQVDGAEREPGHVHDRTEEIEDPERAVVPTGGRPGRERRRGQREQGQRHRPGALVRRLGAGPAHRGGLGEHGRDRGGDEGETGDHERSPR